MLYTLDSSRVSEFGGSQSNTCTELPTVHSASRNGFPSQIKCNKEVFPTPESPTTTSFNDRGSRSTSLSSIAACIVVMHRSQRWEGTVHRVWVYMCVCACMRCGCRAIQVDVV
eukprot:m.94887 g.94887  ORF g.94887 m.94887 type:complete len:113 (+) comp26763_c1_seq1:533-871(+)